jgi:N-acetylglucosamine-6-phosphate deacetylase
VVGAALEDADSWCGVIVDGVHVDPAVLKIALRLKGRDKVMLATDAMPCVGTDETSFMLQGRRIEVRDGACFAEDGTLAGSSLDMASAVRNAVRLLGLSLAEAARMASGNPAAFIKLDAERGRIAAGYFADLVLVDDDLQVLDTWIGGESASEDAGSAARGGSRSHA